MNLFNKAKAKKTTKSCQYCKVEFAPDKRNINRGWGLCCSKSCATSLRNKLNRLPNSELVKEVRDIRLNQLGID
jgi:hypothetical protein